ncbi:MAG TPA: DUF5678 domain-containing protein, partial [Thermoplasmata archaeon]|nr:DUF5678 domain-containing protein [Thermoplasmata archaeon]
LEHAMPKKTQGNHTVESRSVWRDFVWLSGRNLSKYRGQWIVIHERKVVAADKDLDKALRKANLPPDEPPFIHRVPQEESFLVL